MKELVFGHKNPDTDAICAAKAYSYLQNQRGFETEAVALGEPNEETKFDFFDMDFNHLPFTNGHPNSKEWDKIKRPKGQDEMKKYAEILQKGLTEERIDIYDINGKVYFGEITFFHWSGFERFEPAEWDEKFGSWITLPTK